MAVERRAGRLQGELPGDLNLLAPPFVQQRQHLHAQLLHRRDAAVQAQPRNHRELALDQCPEGARQLADFGV